MPKTKWGDRPYELKEGVRKWNGRLTDCPVCWLVKGQHNRMKTVGKRYPKQDRPVECPACHRRWESLRFFLYYWCPHWVPRIEDELRTASGVDVHNDMTRAEHEESLWRREQQVKQAVEAGTWSPRLPDDLSTPTDAEMAHFDPDVHTPTWARKAPAWLPD